MVLYFYVNDKKEFLVEVFFDNFAPICLLMFVPLVGSAGERTNVQEDFLRRSCVLQLH